MPKPIVHDKLNHSQETSANIPQFMCPNCKQKFANAIRYLAHVTECQAQEGAK